MTICYSIKLNEQEKAAIKTTQTILHEMSNDDIISTLYSSKTDYDLGGISRLFDDVVDYLKNFEE